MSDSFPGVNFARYQKLFLLHEIMKGFRLFSCNERQVRQDCVAEKLKCIMHYFRRVTDKSKNFCISASWIKYCMSLIF